jgi:hypothetical protein
VDQRSFGKEVKIGDVSSEDTQLLKKHVGDFCAYFGVDNDEIFKRPFTKIYPYSYRPYETIYAYQAPLFLFFGGEGPMIIDKIINQGGNHDCNAIG